MLIRFYSQTIQFQAFINLAILAKTNPWPNNSSGFDICLSHIQPESELVHVFSFLIAIILIGLVKKNEITIIALYNLVFCSRLSFFKDEYQNATKIEGTLSYGPTLLFYIRSCSCLNFHRSHRYSCALTPLSRCGKTGNRLSVFIFQVVVDARISLYCITRFYLCTKTSMCFGE